MLLRNNLYTISQKEINGLNGCFTIELNSSHFIYLAHFPEEPPHDGRPRSGAVQIGQELLELLLEESCLKKYRLEIKKVKNVKFLSVISPKNNTTIVYTMKKVEMSEDAMEVKAQIDVSFKDEIKAKISLVLSVSC